MINPHFERRKERLLPKREFFGRLGRSFAVFSAALAFALAIGVAGYHGIGGLPWIDSLLNASMILTGMGPVDRMQTQGGKLFASGYAIFSGVAFLSSVGILLAPVVHRFLHRFHLEEEP